MAPSAADATAAGLASGGVNSLPVTWGRVVSLEHLVRREQVIEQERLHHTQRLTAYVAVDDSEGIGQRLLHVDVGSKCFFDLASAFSRGMGMDM